MGVGARSGWRVHALNLSSTHSRARPRTTAPTAAPHHHPTPGATATPTAQNPAPQAHDLNPHRTQPNAAGALPQPIAACTTSRPSAASRPCGGLGCGGRGAPRAPRDSTERPTRPHSPGPAQAGSWARGVRQQVQHLRGGREPDPGGATSGTGTVACRAGRPRRTRSRRSPRAIWTRSSRWWARCRPSRRRTSGPPTGAGRRSAAKGSACRRRTTPRRSRRPGAGPPCGHGRPCEKRGLRRTAAASPRVRPRPGRPVRAPGRRPRRRPRRRSRPRCSGR